MSPNLLISPIALPEPFPQGLPAPKFQLGQKVVWSQVPTHGFGEIIGIIFASSISVRATGYHYAVRLDPSSPSRADQLADWAFEEDLELLKTHAHLLGQPETAQSELEQ